VSHDIRSLNGFAVNAPCYCLKDGDVGVVLMLGTNEKDDFPVKGPKGTPFALVGFQHSAILHPYMALDELLPWRADGQ
jgi:hypothetical protein